MIGFLLVAIAAVDPCAAVVPAPHPSVEASRLYERIGDEQLAHGDADAATYAFRRAVELNPVNEHARLALLSVCRTAGTEDLFAEALRRLDAGDRLGAIALLRRAQEPHPDPSAALVEGIALYELGQDAESERALKIAGSDPTLTDAARLFLGLIAIRSERDRDARILLEQAAQANDLHIRTSAREALHNLAGPARLTVDAAAGGGYDSNPGLSPSGNPLPGGDYDGYAGTSVGGQWTPLGQSSPFVTLGGEYRRNFVLAAFNIADIHAGAGWQWRNRSFGARAGYVFDYLAQGADAYLRSNRGDFSGWWTPGLFTVAASYSVRAESFLPDDLAGFSGWRHDTGLLGAIDLEPVSISIGYAFARELADEKTWSFFEHGPRVSATVHLGPPVFLGVDGVFWLRTYDEPLGAPQMDEGLRASAFATWWIREDVGVRAAVSWWRNLSNISDFTSSRLTASLDVLYSLRVR